MLADYYWTCPQRFDRLFELRQVRFRHAPNHPHDVMAVARDAAERRTMERTLCPDEAAAGVTCDESALTDDDRMEWFCPLCAKGVPASMKDRHCRAVHPQHEVNV